MLIVGGNDHIVPVAVLKAVLKKHLGPTMVEYEEFGGYTHHIVGQTGWKYVLGEQNISCSRLFREELFVRHVSFESRCS